MFELVDGHVWIYEWTPQRDALKTDWTKCMPKIINHSKRNSQNKWGVGEGEKPIQSSIIRRFLRFKNEQDIQTSSKIHEESDYGHDLGALIISLSH